MVKGCTRIFGRRRDRRLAVERELAQFIRGLMQFVYPSSAVPAAYDVTALLKPVELECAEVDTNLYRLHFGQYFRFDISAQLPYFYKSVQKLLVGLCNGLTSMWQRVWAMCFSLNPFDPDLIHSGSDDRRTDVLVETCAVLTARGLLDIDRGGAVQQEYLEVTQYFKRRWSALQEGVPVVEDVISMWMSYPHWERNQHLRRVVDLVFGIVVVSPYVADLVDDSQTALDPDTLVSSLHFVRSWFRHSFAGRSRRNPQGWLRVTDSSDMLESRLSDGVPAKPCDQLLKVGLDSLRLGGFYVTLFFLTEAESTHYQQGQGVCDLRVERGVTTAFYCRF